MDFPARAGFVWPAGAGAGNVRPSLPFEFAVKLSSMTFVGRLALVVILSVVGALIAVALYAYEASARVGAEIERARVSHLLTSLKDTTEANLSIGLSLDEIAPLQALIEREKAGDPSVLAIDIFNVAGRAVFSTDRSAVGESVPASWSAHLRDPAGWRAGERGESIFGLPFENDIAVAGGIALTVSDEARRISDERLGIDLLLRALGLGLGAGLLALAAALAFARLMMRPFERAGRILDGTDDGAVAGDALIRLATAAAARFKAADARINDGLARLRGLDDAA